MRRHTAALLALLAACSESSGPQAVPARLIATSPITQTAAVATSLPAPIAVRVEDASATPLRGVRVKWRVLSGGGEVVPVEDGTTADGLARAQWTLGPKAGVQRIGVQVSALSEVIFEAAATAGAPSTVTALAPSQSGFVGTALRDSLRVRVEDAYGNPAPGVAVQWSVAAGGGILSSNTTTTGAGGTSAVQWTLGDAHGPQRVTARTRENVATTFDATAMPVAISRIAMDTASRDGFVGNVLSPRASVAKDEQGNAFANRKVVWSSSDPSVARIDSTGAVQAVAGGTSVITAKVGDVTASYPLRVRAFTEISVGGLHSCALTTEGEVFCWGLNTSGQLGIGADVTTCAGLQGQRLPCSPHPVAVAGNLRFAKLAAGLYHNCGITVAGDVYCWGGNGGGQLGAPSISRCVVAGGSGGTISCSRSPLKVPVTKPVVAVSAGYFQTCALHTDGSVSCWGSDSANRPISGIVEAPEPFTSISAGSGFTVCGLGASGKAYCWGNIWERRQENGWHLGFGVPKPQLVSNESFTQIMTGGLSACGLRSDGSMQCWGGNWNGEFGNGNDTGSKTPVAGASGMSFATVQTGSYHVCGLTINGEAFCWGSNTYGALGVTSVPDQCAPDLNGSRYPCSFRPVPVSGGYRYTSIDNRSGGHSCAIRTDGAALCWGNGSSGQLGQGVRFAGFVPSPVTPASSTSSSVADHAMQPAAECAAGTCYMATHRRVTSDGNVRLQRADFGGQPISEE